MVRPEELRLVSPEERAEGLTARVVDRRFAGASSHYRVRTAQGWELVVATPGAAPRLEGEVAIRLADGALAHAFPEAQ
jgi:hypothetical protein